MFLPRGFSVYQDRRPWCGPCFSPSPDIRRQVSVTPAPQPLPLWGSHSQLLQILLMTPSLFRPLPLSLFSTEVIMTFSNWACAPGEVVGGKEEIRWNYKKNIALNHKYFKYESKEGTYCWADCNIRTNFLIVQDTPFLALSLHGLSSACERELAVSLLIRTLILKDQDPILLTSVNFNSLLIVTPGVKASTKKSEGNTIQLSP